MSKFSFYIILSLALHIFAVFPLLAEQFTGQTEEHAVLPERTALPMPKIFIKPAKQVVAAVSLEPVVQPAVTPMIQKTTAQADVKPLLQPKKVQPPQVAKPVAQAAPQPIKTVPAAVQQRVAKVEESKLPQPSDSAAIAVTKNATLDKQQPVRSTASKAMTAVQAALPAAEVISKEPRFARAPAVPVYPAQAKRRQQQGTVWVAVRLDAQGKQLELRVLRSSALPSLDQAALAAVRKWQFLPETRNGMGVPSRVHIPIEFAITAQR